MIGCVVHFTGHVSLLTVAMNYLECDFPAILSAGDSHAKSCVEEFIVSFQFKETLNSLFGTVENHIMIDYYFAYK